MLTYKNHIKNEDYEQIEKLALMNGLIPNPKGSVIFTSHAVFASQLRTYDSFEREVIYRFDSPGLFGEHYIAFPVRGNSMYPEIKQGEIIIVRKMETMWHCGTDKLKLMEEISKNKLYVVRNSKGDAWIKYLEPVKNDKGEIVKLQLISANKEPGFEPFWIEVDEEIEIFKVVRHVRNTE